LEKVAVVQRWVKYSRRPPIIVIASRCPYCETENERPFTITFAPEVVRCAKCRKPYIDSFRVHGDAEELSRMLKEAVEGGTA